MHKDFRLNGFSFKNSDRLLEYSKSLPEEIHSFFQDWFSSNQTTITVKTSGSTGKPKLIGLEKEHMVNSAIATGNYFNLPAKTSALLCLPVQFIAGKMMLVRAITLGWHLDVVEPSSTPLETRDKNYDFSAMVSLQVENSLEKINSIKTLIIGGGVVSYSLQQKLQNISTTVFATYGMTETITHIAVKKLNKIDSSNVFYEVLPNINIFVDERSCLVIQAQKISKALVITNDVVQLITNTTFEWLGRFDNVINSGGIKLQPEQIEAKLKPYLSQRFFITGIPDAILGEKLVLIIEGIKNNSLENACQHLFKYEKPKEIYFVPKFIETSTQKINRVRTKYLIFNT